MRALLPRGPGHQFVFYGDSCSGVPGARHEATLASVNAVVRAIAPQPEFVLFLGDEIAGLTADADELRQQWRHWLEREMGWLNRQTTPLWHTTGNHTVYDTMSEAVFREMLGHLPRNGPPGQEGLSYWIRRGDLLLAFVNTLWSGLGGEGHVETAWLRSVLHEHTDARYKLVVGHHPVFPVNGFAGAYQREVGPEHGAALWDLLVDAEVRAYLCSHILAFDVQVHRGVLQICTAGAGTAHRMPEGIEYLHCVQAALDAEGLRYQVLDTLGEVRERLSWPLVLPPLAHWRRLPFGEQAALLCERAAADRVVAFRFTGRLDSNAAGSPQTLLSAFEPGVLGSLWIGLRGLEQRLTVVIGPEAGRSPHYWLGPPIVAGAPFDIVLVVHTGMGPGGIMYRATGDGQLSSLQAASPWGAERLDWPSRWTVGHAQDGVDDRPFRGAGLAVSAAGA